MSNIREILKLVATDKNIKNDFINIESMSELFKICETKGYSKTKAEFEIEFEELLKESRLLELNNDELLKISGGASWNIKKIPTLVLASLTIGGNISTVGFAKNSNINTSISASKQTSENKNISSLKNDISNKISGVSNFVKQNKKPLAIAGGSGITGGLLGVAGTLWLKNILSSSPNSQETASTVFEDDVSVLKNKDLVLNLPENIKWKMVIDARFHDTNQGKMIFDNGGKNKEGNSASAEKGYLSAMLKAWDRMIDSIKNNRKLNADIYKEFHDLAVTGVALDGKQDKNIWRFNNGSSVFFRLVDKSNFNAEGLREFILKPKSKWKFEEKLNCKIESGKFYGGSFKESKDSKSFVDDVFKEYYEKLDELKKKDKVEGSYISETSSLEDKKLEIIIRTCQALDQAHVFWDGNIRTAVFITMNKMLIENGLNPTCMHNPNTLDCTDVKTLIQQVKTGQAYFLKLVGINS